MPGCTIAPGCGKNSGKGAALAAGFKRATEMGYTHAITMDADGQHFADDVPKFLARPQAQPDALAVGVRDFFAAGCPTHRRRSNAVSTFWFRVETGVRLGDTQCGFRCYPLALTQSLCLRSGRYALELEFMVRASWIGTPIVPVPVHCTYAPDQIRLSHFRPVKDLAHITFMNIGLVLQSWFVPRTLRVLWSCGKKIAPPSHPPRILFRSRARSRARLSLRRGPGFVLRHRAHLGFSNDCRRCRRAFSPPEQGHHARRQQYFHPARRPHHCGCCVHPRPLDVHRRSPRAVLAPHDPRPGVPVLHAISRRQLRAGAHRRRAVGATGTYVLARLFRRK